MAGQATVAAAHKYRDDTQLYLETDALLESPNPGCLFVAHSYASCAFLPATTYHLTM